MHAFKSPRVAIVTASFARDIEAFALLRDSIERFAPTFKHIAVVHTEDFAQFKARFGHQKTLTLWRTADVLPRSLERKRKVFRHRWLKDIFRWAFARWYSGWHFQQLSKIYTLAKLPYEAAMFLDSDCFIREPLNEDWCFNPEGKLKLFEQCASNAEQMAFDATTYRIFRKPLNQIEKLKDYIYQPACFYRRTAQRLLVELHKRSAWHYRFLNETMPSEYNLLGFCATQLENYADYELVNLPPDGSHHALRFQDDKDDLAQFMEGVATDPKPFVWIQSTLRLKAKTRQQIYQKVVGQTSTPLPENLLKAKAREL